MVRTNKKKIYDREFARDYNKRLRMSVLEILGNKCVDCGFSDYRALQIDHINGGGSKERAKSGNQGPYYRKVIESVLNNKNIYQLLCANCNWIKRFREGEHRKVSV